MITEKQYLKSKKIIAEYEIQQFNKTSIITYDCKINRDPNKCTVNLYTEKGCKGCYYTK